MAIPHEPTPEQRDQVAKLAGLGLTTKQIAHVQNVSQATIERHYMADLERGRADAINQVTQTAFQMAVSGKVPVMTMFWLKTRARWRETDRETDKGNLDALIDKLTPKPDTDESK